MERQEGWDEGLGHRAITEPDGRGAQEPGPRGPASAAQWSQQDSPLVSESVPAPSHTTGTGSLPGHPG